MKKPNEKIGNEQRPKRESDFTPGSFFGIGDEF